jgi:gamma-glutamylcyclotransferase (GGCT)/AIG2-like uncharacterized protein YtfP
VLFVYGTLRRGFEYHEHYLRDSEFLGEARTREHYALYVEIFPFAVKVPPVAPVVGELYRVNEETLEAIDILEGHPDAYRREPVLVVSAEGVPRRAWMYFYPEPCGRLVASGDYRDAAEDP